MKTFITAALSMLVMVSGSQALSADELQVVGNLQARGTVEIATETAQAPIRLSNTTYAYMTGDVIRTGRGSAMLEVSGLGRIGFAENTEASVADAEQGTAVELTSGGLAYNLTPGSAFTIQANGMTIQPTRSPVQEVSAGNSANAAGWVAIGEDGQVKVGSRSGEVEITQGGTRQVVAAGQQSVLQFQGGRLIATQFGGGGFGGLAGVDVLMLGIMAVGVGFAAYEIADDTGSTEGRTTPATDGAPASP